MGVIDQDGLREKRLRDDLVIPWSESGPGAEAKRLRKVANDVATELRCPITNELPIDPVMAADGHCYENSAIKKWFSQNPEQVRSPVTNLPMGKNLIRVVQLRNITKHLVTSNDDTKIMDANMADELKKKIKDHEKMTSLLKRCEKGDVKAMRELGVANRDGLYGLEADSQKAFEWFQQAADQKDPTALGLVGIAYLSGHGVAQNIQRGISWVSMAACLDSAGACGVLGFANSQGHYGFDKNIEQASHWFRKMQKCDINDANAALHRYGTDWLRAHP